MLLGNYGRDQMGESSFADQHHQITPGLLHPSIIHQQADVSSQSASSSLTADRNGLKPSPPPDHQMLGRSAGAGGAGGGSSQQQQQQQEQQRRLKPHSDQVLKCPRCESMNTKFCYYNNYSLTQPRHFCKNCKRYWTKGGALRNVPVGGGCRKNKRVKHRSHQDQQQAPSSSAATSDEQAAAAAAAGGGGGLGNHDGASSSGILAQQQEFSPSTSSFDHHPIKVSNGMASSLPFDRVDLPLRNIFPGGGGGGGGGGNPPPISINWAGQLHQQPFESSSSILGLNLSAAIKQEPIHPPEMNSMFHDPSSLAMAGAMNHHHHHPHGLASYVSMDNFGVSAGNPGEILWRFPQQPKLVSLLEDGNEHDHELEAGSRGLLDLEIGADKMLMKQQLIKKSISRDLDLHQQQQQPQVSSDYEQGESASSPDQWQPNSSATDGFFNSSGGQGGETQGFWSNGGGWSSADLHHSYGASQATGNHHQLL